MKIYTKGGDKGSTSLLGGRRVSKSASRVEAYGTLDELGVSVALALEEVRRFHPVFSDLADSLSSIQWDLFGVASMVADPDNSQGTVSDLAKATKFIEDSIDALDGELPTLTNFVLPGGNFLNLYLHQARTICRRAERCLVGLAESEFVSDDLLRFINRLSDWFFVASRAALIRKGVEEHRWLPRQRKA